MNNILIISNNVISNTNNNGKTILSFFEGRDDFSVAQLYFSGEVPEVEGFKYYRLSDKDILSGLFNISNKGSVVEPSVTRSIDLNSTLKRKIGKNDITQTARDLLWLNKWKSKGLIEWLDSFDPNIIFFVAGDALFPYWITSFIQKRYNAKLTIYVTDDYIMPRSNETLLHYFRRNTIKNHLCRSLKNTSHFFTVSEVMKTTYQGFLGYDSSVILNMTEDLYCPKNINNDKLTLVYAGSFYYGRDKVLFELSKILDNYNSLSNDKCAQLELYSNSKPENNTLKMFESSKSCVFKGSLSRDELKDKLNSADILVFVESFEDKFIEKVKCSLSTKVPEYMSVGKPIITIGPSNIGSVSYLQDVSFCVDYENLDTISSFLPDISLQYELGIKARSKYLNKHNKNKLQQEFLSYLL